MEVIVSAPEHSLTVGPFSDRQHSASAHCTTHPPTLPPLYSLSLMAKYCGNELNTILV